MRKSGKNLIKFLYKTNHEINHKLTIVGEIIGKHGEVWKFEKSLVELIEIPLGSKRNYEKSNHGNIRYAYPPQRGKF